MSKKFWNDRLNLIINLLVLGILMYVLVTPGGYIHEKVTAYQRQADQQAAVDKVWQGLATDEARIVDTGGPVGLVAFGDYECPACRKAHGRTRELAGDLGVDLVYRHLPLTEIHPAAEGAALAAICAEQFGRFPAMHQRLYEHEQWQEDRDWLRLARAVGIDDTDGFRSCLDSEYAAVRLERDRALAERLDVKGTPAFIGRDGVHMGMPRRESLAEIVRPGSE